MTSEVYRMKRSGPNTEPCGTPYFSWIRVDWWPLKVTDCCRPWINDEIHANAVPPTPYDFWSLDFVHLHFTLHQKINITKGHFNQTGSLVQGMCSVFFIESPLDIRWPPCRMKSDSSKTSANRCITPDSRKMTTAVMRLDTLVQLKWKSTQSTQNTQLNSIQFNSKWRFRDRRRQKKLSQGRFTTKLRLDNKNNEKSS